MTFDRDPGTAGVRPLRAMPRRLRAGPAPKGEEWSLIAEEDGAERKFKAAAMVHTFMVGCTAIAILPVEGEEGRNGQLTGSSGLQTVSRLD